MVRTKRIIIFLLGLICLCAVVSGYTYVESVPIGIVIAENKISPDPYIVNPPPLLGERIIPSYLEDGNIIVAGATGPVSQQYVVFQTKAKDRVHLTVKFGMDASKQISPNVYLYVYDFGAEKWVLVAGLGKEFNLLTYDFDVPVKEGYKDYVASDRYNIHFLVSGTTNIPGSVGYSHLETHLFKASTVREGFWEPGDQYPLRKMNVQTFNNITNMQRVIAICSYSVDGEVGEAEYLDRNLTCPWKDINYTVPYGKDSFECNIQIYYEVRERDAYGDWSKVAEYIDRETVNVPVLDLTPPQEIIEEVKLSAAQRFMNWICNIRFLSWLPIC